MSDMDKDIGPIAPGSPLGKVLDGFTAPEMPDGFADRVVAATEGRAATLPTPRANGARWRSVRRLAIGALAAGALGTAAAATGVLEELGVELPSPQQVWSTITGSPPAPPPVSPAEQQRPAIIPETNAPVTIEGPIDTPEELEEAFRRVDEVLDARRENRRGRVDQRIDNVIERRREQGLPAPTPEQEERLMDSVDRFRERRDGQLDERIEGRREEFRERIENGEELTREDFLRELREDGQDGAASSRLQRLRDMTPEQRREALRRFRERRQDRLNELQQEASPLDAPDEAVSEEPLDPEMETTEPQVDDSPE